MMLPQKHASVRYRSRPATLIPFRDDTSLVAFRYDQTAQAEPPIPILPAKSPLRYQRSVALRPDSATISAPLPPPPTATSAAHVPISVPAPMVIAFSSPPSSLLSPPCPPPTGPLPLPPTEEHPALRIATTTQPRLDIGDPKRDSGHAATTSSKSQTFYADSSEDDEDPFPYEQIHRPIRTSKLLIPELTVPPLRIGSSSPTSLYSEQQPPVQRRGHSVSGGSQSSIPLYSPGLSETFTVSPTSPTTPPPNFPEKQTTATNSSPSLFSRRSFSFRTSTSMKATRRLQKKKQQQQQPPAAVVVEAAYYDEASMSATPLLPKGGVGELPGAKPATSSSSAPVAAAPPLPPLRNGDGQSGQHSFRDQDRARPPSSPELRRGAASAPDDDGFADFVQQISFSNRGSIMLGGMRPSRHAPSMSHDSGIAHQKLQPDAMEQRNSTQRPQRVFPLAPPRSPKPQVDDTASSTIAEGLEDARRSLADGRITPPPRAPFATGPTMPDSPQSLQNPPSIRLISVDVERESQKVRSLYEPGESHKWEDGARASSFGERLEPTVEVPSDVDENASKRSQSPGPSTNQDERPSTPTPATGTPGFAALSALQPDEQTRLRKEYELAGGIEDWEDVEVEDVDRYGFIAPRRPFTPSSAPPAVMDSPQQNSPRKSRNILKKDAAQHSQHLGTKRTPGRKMSVRSLHTQASGFSTTSRRSTRSAIRHATNLLPHNKDRRWMDEAGEMLAQQPGFTSIGDDVAAGQLADEYKHKEWQRAEKWRKMAKVVKPGKEGEGMVFEFDSKNPKLIERTWKGIPDRWRAAAWYSFLASSARNSKKLCATDEELTAKFRTLQEQPSSDDVQIDLDVPRTISQHIMFRKRYRGGQRLLFRVLHALSLYFPVTGYVQGMASLAATLLSYYDEERCFVMLVRLWELRGLNRLYSPNFTELMDALQDFEKYWLAGKDVAKSLKDLCVDPTAYGTRWYLTLFHLSIPFSSQLRIWDVFMLLGSSPPDPPAPETSQSKQVSQHISSRGLEVIHATSTAIILALSDHIVDSEFENAMKALTSFVPVKNDDLLMKVVRAEYKQHTSKMKKI